jgi:hypothetical protein
MIRAEFDGQSAPELIVQHTELHLTATRYSIRFDGQIADAGTFDLMPENPSPPTDSAIAATSSTLLLRADFGPNAGRSVPCIFQLVRDRLRICFGLDGTLPSDFATAANSHRYLATYRRI